MRRSRYSIIALGSVVLVSALVLNLNTKGFEPLEQQIDMTLDDAVIADSVEAPEISEITPRLQVDDTTQALRALGIATSYYAGNSLYVMDNLAERYVAAVQALPKSRAEALFTIFMAMDVCNSIKILKPWLTEVDSKTGIETPVPTKVPQALVVAAEDTFADCALIRASMPEQQQGFWVRSMDALSESAKAGSAVAQYLVFAKDKGAAYPALAMSNAGQAKALYERQLQLLNRALAEGHYASYYHASVFIRLSHHSDGSAENQIESIKWEYLGCTKHPECNASAHLESYNLKLLPAEREEVRRFADDYRTDTELKAGYLPYHVHSAPEHGRK